MNTIGPTEKHATPPTKILLNGSYTPLAGLNCFAVDLGPFLTHTRSASGWTPSSPAIRLIAPLARSGSLRASTAIRVARSRNSAGYFLGALMTVILPCVHCLHQTRGATASSKGETMTQKRLSKEPSFITPSNVISLGILVMCALSG